MKTMVRQADPLQPIKVHGRPDIHLKFVMEPHTGAGGCVLQEAVTLWRPCAGKLQPHGEKPAIEQIFWQDLWPQMRPTLEQFVPEKLYKAVMKNSCLWGGPTLKKFMKGGFSVVEPHTGAGEDHEKEGLAETQHYELTSVPIPRASVPLGQQRR
ncbi:hypothetical protein WISP_141798 [Willisornis vidua]|uniref:Uncharacterized protein n=1 Tax=Willisornis vidua TaxID=1566151 RepID=A0ABQ9CSL3_9PASS|nr:hypothetical protein WISP_141798 [Willisornis vidua]